VNWLVDRIVFGHTQVGGAAPVGLVILDWMECEDGRKAIVKDSSVYGQTQRSARGGLLMKMPRPVESSWIGHDEKMDVRWLS